MLGMNLIYIKSFPRNLFILSQQGHWVEQTISLLGYRQYITVICFHRPVQSEDTILRGRSFSECSTPQSENCLYLKNKLEFHIFAVQNYFIFNNFRMVCRNQYVVCMSGCLLLWTQGLHCPKITLWKLLS